MRKFLRPISFFVCSTYRDMKAERAYLHEVILPQVAPQFEERGFRLEFKDPRYQSRTEEDADGPVGLSQSLAFIDRCRPCFLGFLGSNYGKVLARVPDQIGQHYPEIQFYARSSRLHLEALYGVVQHPHKSEHSFFYFRKPGFMDEMSAADRELLESSTTSTTARATEEFKLRMLKEAIVNCGRPVRHYSCQWDSAARSVVGLESLGEKIVADLLSVIGAIPAAGGAPVAVAVSVPEAVAEAPLAEAPAGEAVPEVSAEPVSPPPAPEPLKLAIPPVPPPLPTEDPFGAVDEAFLKELREAAAQSDEEEPRPMAEETIHGEEEAFKIEDVTPFGEAPALPADGAPIPFPNDEDISLAPDAASSPDQGMQSMTGSSALAHLSGMDAAPSEPPPDSPPPADEPFSFGEEEAGVPMAAPVPPEPMADADGAFAFADEAAPPNVPDAEPVGLLPEDEGTQLKMGPPPGEGDAEAAAVIEECTQKIAANPNDLESYRLRAAAYYTNRNWAGMLADYETLITLEPQDPQAYNDRAWVLAACPEDHLRNGALAVESAQRAVELDGAAGALLFDESTGGIFFRVEFKETLAAALAEAGDFDGAVAAIDGALGLADKKDRPRLLYRRKLFASRQPYRDVPGADDPALYASAVAEEDGDFGEPGVLESALAGPEGEKLRAERKAFMKMVAQGPEDQAPLLAYAGWLTRLGEPLGEFIRTDLELEPMSDADPRRAPLDAKWAELLDKHGKEWLRPLRKLGLNPTVGGQFAPTLWLNHGIVTTVTIDRPDILPEHAAELFEAAPALREVHFEDCAVDIPGLVKLPQMAQVSALGLSRSPMGQAPALVAPDIHMLAQASNLSELTALELNYNDFGAEGAAALAASPHLRSLERLELRSCKIKAEGAAALVGSPLLATVERLVLSGNEIGPDGARALAGSPHIRHVEFLDLDSNDLGPDAAEAIAASPTVGRIKTLLLSWNLMDEGVRAIAASIHLNKLETLGLAGNDIKSGAATALAASHILATVKELELDRNAELGAEGARALASSPHLAQLTELKIGYCGIGDDGATALAASDKLPALRSLVVAGNGITAEGARALAYSSTLANLTDLDLRENNLGPEGIQALVESPYLVSITSLWLTDTNFAPDQEELLKQRFGEAVVLY